MPKAKSGNAAKMLQSIYAQAASNSSTTHSNWYPLQQTLAQRFSTLGFLFAFVRRHAIKPLRRRAALAVAEEAARLHRQCSRFILGILVSHFQLTSTLFNRSIQLARVEKL